MITGSRTPLVRLQDDLDLKRQAIYLGFDGEGTRQFASVESHLLVLGPTGIGKTASLIVPSVACHNGPVVIVSTKKDILEATVGARRQIADTHGSGIFQVDLGLVYPDKSEVRTWSAAEGCELWATALDRAEVMVDTNEPRPVDRLWPALQKDLLAACLHAAALSELSEYDIAAHIKSGNIDEIYDHLVAVKGYDDTAVHTLWRFHSQNFDSMADDTRRSAFAVTSSGALRSFEYQSASMAPHLSIKEFIGGQGALYITVPRERAIAIRPRVTGLIDAIVRSWTDDPGTTGTLLLALDEVANASPIPSLPGILTEGRGHGIQVIMGMQLPSQAAHWGDQADTVLGGATHVALFPGTRADRYLTELSHSIGSAVRYDREVHVDSGAPGGPHLADHERLISERKVLEAARSGLKSAARIRATRRAIREIVRRRQKDGIRPRLEGENGLLKNVEDELERFTTIREVPKRLPRFDLDELAGGEQGTYFLWSAEFAGHVKVTRWYQDKLWIRLLSE